MIRTERLFLRGWTGDDVLPHRAMCRDPRVSAMLGPVPDDEALAAVVDRQNGWLAEHGYCFWALEHEGRFGGWCGLKPGGVPHLAHEAEIGWSLHPDLWGRGMATEAASAVLDFAWERTDRARVVAITAAVNARSLAVMRRLGMVPLADGGFDHPALSADSPLLAHVIYEIVRPAHD